MEQYFPQTRLLRVSSREATVKRSNGDYEIDLGNSLSEIADGIQGISVLGFGFMNTDPNVTEDTLFGNGGLAAPLQTNIIVPKGQYDFSQLAALLAPQGHILTCTLDAQGFVTITTDGTFSGLYGPGWSTYLGFDESQYNDLSGSITAANLPSLQGLQTAYLHSASLVQGVHSVDSEGLIVSFMAHGGVTVPFGFHQVCNTDQQHYASVAYKAPATLRTLNIALRDVTGRVIESSGEVWAVFRLWV